MQAHKDERSLGELFSDLASETSTLVRQEVELAKTELSQKATRVGKDVGFLVAGGAVAYAGFLALVAALAIGLGQLGLPWWAATLLVGLVVGGIGAALVMKGLEALKRETVVPERTVASLKEDVEWARKQTR